MSLLYERDYGVRLMDLPPSVKGFVKRSDDYYTIIVNSRHTWEQNRRSFKHETDHLEDDDYGKDNVDTIEATAHKDKGVRM